MDDDLLKRADRAMRDNQIIRAQCVWNLMQARAASAGVKGTLRWARDDTTKSRQLGLETADRLAAALERREANETSGSSDKTWP
jgi:hypothetical protein